MDRRRELGEFLARRRGQVDPTSVPLPYIGGVRRVSGLRREEVALLAGISTTYYTRLERGKVGGISDAVLHGLVDALQLTPQEADYVASAITVTGWKPQDVGAPDSLAVPVPIQRLLDAVATQPILVLNERCDIVASNSMGRALYPYHFEEPADAGRPINSVRFLFTDPRARSYYIDWERWAHQGVAYVRAALARHPRDRSLIEFIEELRAASTEFDLAWGSRDVHFDPVGMRSINHPVVGQLDLDFQTLHIVGSPTLRMTSYSADADSVTSARLAELDHSAL